MQAFWERLPCKLSTVCRRRELLLYAFRQDAVPDGFQDASMSVDVHGMDISAYARSRYALADVIGLDCGVLAVIPTQARTA